MDMIRSLDKDLEAQLAELTRQQRTYAAGRLRGLAPTQAARMAGYATPERNSTNLERHPAIRQAIITGQKVAFHKLKLDRDHVLEGLMDAVRASSTATELVSAWREIGKIIGVYEPIKVDVSVQARELTQAALSAMSDQELAKLAELHGVIDAEFTEIPHGEDADTPSSEA